MTKILGSLTSTDLIAGATQALTEAGYRRIVGGFEKWETSSTRLFEDEYNVVGVVVFNTCEELLRAWSDMQGSLVDVITNYIGQNESKAWDGYLVLLTPSVAPSLSADITSIRQDTLRLRKLVATGDDLRDSKDVERVLWPLLPMSLGQIGLQQESAIDLLPKLLTDQGIPAETTQKLVEAFKEQLPLMEQLHQTRGEQ